MLRKPNNKKTKYLNNKSTKQVFKTQDVVQDFHVVCVSHLSGEKCPCVLMQWTLGFRYSMVNWARGMRNTLCWKGNQIHSCKWRVYSGHKYLLRQIQAEKNSLTKKKLLLSVVSRISASVERVKTAARFLSSTDTARHRKLHTYTETHSHWSANAEKHEEKRKRPTEDLNCNLPAF